MFFFERLRQPARFEMFIAPEVERPVQADPTRNDMNVIMPGVAMPYQNPLMLIRIKSEATKIVPRDLIPPARVQAFTGWQGKA